MSNLNVNILVMLGAITSLILLSVANVEHVFAPTKEKFRAKLEGDSQIPPVNTTANGDAKIKVKLSKIVYAINITGIPDPTGAHMHMGKSGASGPVVFDFLETGKSNKTTISTFIDGKIKESGLTGPLEGKTHADLISAMNSGDIYVDVHSAKNPNGEIRGQLSEYGNVTAATTINATATTNDTGGVFINPSAP